MKKIIAGIVALLMVIAGIVAFKNAGVKAVEKSNVQMEEGLIILKISPAESVEKVLAIRETDTLTAMRTYGNQFQIMAPSAIYTVTIIAKSPYKNVVLKDVEIVDMGHAFIKEIKLEK